MPTGFVPPPVGADETERVVGGVGAGTPDLRTVEDPHVAVPVRAGGETGEVRPAPWLGQELRQDLLALEHRGEVRLLLLLVPVSKMVGAQTLKVGMFSTSGISYGSDSSVKAR
jgi:hypothetical protein